MIRRNHKTGEVSLDPLRWGLIPYWCEDPKGGRKPINAKRETVHTLNIPRGISATALDTPSGKSARLSLSLIVLYFSAGVISCLTSTHSIESASGISAP